jgi:hypothetical protein
VNLSPTGWPAPVDDRQQEQRWPRGGKRLSQPAWPVRSVRRWKPEWIPEFSLNGGMFYSPPVGDATIGRPGDARFGVATDWAAGELFLQLTHIPSGSVINDVAGSVELNIPFADPFADSTGAGFLVGSGTDAFVRSTLGYSIGTPGAAGFAVGYDLDEDALLIEVRHSASNSIVNDVPSTATISLPSDDPYADATASGFTFDGDPFPLPDDGYSIGTAGAAHFGIATDLDTDEAIIDPIHTASLSIM